MSQMSDFLEAKLLEHVFKATAYSSPTTVYLGLFTSATDDAAGGTEVSGNGYGRQPIAFAAAQSPGGIIQNSGLVAFPAASPSGWGTITHFAIYDASTNGNRLVYGSLSVSKLINAGDRIEFAIGDISITFA